MTPPRHSGRLLALLLLLAAVFAWAPVVHAAGRNTVVEVSLRGVLTAPSVDLLQQAVSGAEHDSAQILVVDINSPGGSGSAVASIITALESSSVPTVTVVGSQDRALAGALYVAEAGDVVAVAPDAQLGSSHPLTLRESVPGAPPGGAGPLMAWLVQRHGRDASLPLAAVTRGITLSGQQALAGGAADVEAGPQQVLNAVNGRSVTTPDGTVTLSTSGASVSSVSATGWDAVGLVLADPNLDFTLLLVALVFLGLFLSHPGAVLFAVAAIAGALAGVAGLLLLPLTPLAGLALLAGMLLVVVDLHATSHGALTAVGVIGLAVGGHWLIDTSMLESGISTSFLVLTVLIVLGAYAGLMPRILEARRLPHADPADQLVGRTATVTEELTPSGMVMLDGALWSATSTRGRVPVGMVVMVEQVEGLHLTVAPQAASAPLASNGVISPPGPVH